MSTEAPLDAVWDVIVIGAGPSGLASAIEVRRAGLTALTIDKGCVVNSLFHYPSNMTFFTTPELLEIGDLPFPSANAKPNREEALEYYRRAAAHYQLQIRPYERVERITGADGGFVVYTSETTGGVEPGAMAPPVEEGAAHKVLPTHAYPSTSPDTAAIRRHEYRGRKLVIATGYYDLPNIMGVPGEDLPKVFHYYREPHPYFDNDVLVIGAKNSAAISALELWRHGARVTMVHRGAAIDDKVKYWIKPDIENRIKNGEIAAYFNSVVKEITRKTVVLETPNGALVLKNDFVFALTGYHPDYPFLRSLGVELSPNECRPTANAETLESNVPGIYVAGVIVAGSKTSEIFIENGRFHGQRIAADLKKKLAGNI
jgi:thioredoxin reductase (NADPH)